MPYILLLGINFFFLYFVGLLPARILDSGSNLELAGIFFLVLGFVAWVPALILSIVSYFLLTKFVHVQKIKPIVIFIVSLFIQLVGLVSVLVPILGIRYSIQKSMAAFSLEPTIVSKSFDPDSQTYSFTATVKNSSGKIFENVGMTTTIGFAKDIGAKNYYNLFPGNSIEHGHMSFPPGLTTIRGSVFMGDCRGSDFFRDLPVKIGIQLVSNGSAQTGTGFLEKNFYFNPDTEKIDFTQYLRNHCTWEPQKTP